MGRDRFALDDIFGDTFLVTTERGKDGECARMDLGTAVGHDADHDLLPGVLAPRVGTGARAEVGNVFHDTVQGTAEKYLVFLLSCDGGGGR